MKITLKWYAPAAAPRIALWAPHVLFFQAREQISPLLVAIDGQSAAAKSTLACYIQQRIPNTVVLGVGVLMGRSHS
jgi:hypothetical protein